MYDEFLTILDAEFYADVDAGLRGADDTDDTGIADYATYEATRHFARLEGITSHLEDGSIIRLTGEVTYFYMASGAREFVYHATILFSRYDAIDTPINLRRTPNEWGDWEVVF